MQLKQKGKVSWLREPWALMDSLLTHRSLKKNYHQVSWNHPHNEKGKNATKLTLGSQCCLDDKTG